MNFLSLSTEYLESKGAIHTAREINQQPAMWEKTYQLIAAGKSCILNFLQKFSDADQPQVILTGAGSSAFIGESLVGPFQKEWGIICKAVSTTDIVTHPENYFIKTKPTLLISFARSGNSPESLHTCELARHFCDDLYELNITCNKQGALAKQNQSKKTLTILLPDETNDESLAMTSSFSSMLIAGLFLAHIRKIEQLNTVVSSVCKMGDYILNNYLPVFLDISKIDFKRMVFLGSGPLLGIAHESHLKVQEMSDGKVICKYDSFLGFRHGPKAVVNADTFLVYLFTNQAKPRLYELDLLGSVNETAAGEKSLVIGNDIDDKKYRFDLSIQFPEEINALPEEFLSVFYVLPAQLIAFFKSLHLGLSPDSPSKSGAISRVVQGVTIYPISE